MDTSQTIRALIVPHVQQLYRLREAADRLDMPYNTVQDQALQGRIPGAFKVGGLWRVRAGEFESWRLGFWDPAAETWEAWADRVGLYNPAVA